MNKSRVAPDTELAGYPANLFCRISIYTAKRIIILSSFSNEKSHLCVKLYMKAVRCACASAIDRTFPAVIWKFPATLFKIREP